ncbi:MAG: bis(5'-nucleosyl)-tetraphosphatase (symmetrical) YqeK [Chloroflexota bacterium]|nr:bis(5'-nucleosyl)-tetraphosphatase (symmetrical) YqeK [Chloroflexota bacterium]
MREAPLLPDALHARLNALPAGLQAHVERVRNIARGLAERHGIDAAQADLAAAAHDVARHLLPAQLLAESERLGLRVNAVERRLPTLLHGPVGAAWLATDGWADADTLDAVRWHTTARDDLSPLGQVVFIADKLDPAKARAYPFQDAVREAAEASLADGALAFLDGHLRQLIDGGGLAHPAAVEARNGLLLSRGAC